MLTVGCNIMAGICPLITIHITSNYRWQYAMLLPGLLAITCSPLAYIMIYNSRQEAGLSGNGTTDNTTAERKTPVKSWNKVLVQLLRSSFLWVLLLGDFLTAVMKNGISDWLQLFLIQDKKLQQSTGNTQLYVCDDYYYKSL